MSRNKEIVLKKEVRFLRNAAGIQTTISVSVCPVFGSAHFHVFSRFPQAVFVGSSVSNVSAFLPPGGGRYSSPQCVNLGEIGDSCRPVGTTPFNTTVEYPNGYSVTLTNIYFVMCACASGLECDLRSSRCQVP
jgi:hypothetical protein